MADHPVVEEFLRSYESVLTFKENLSRVFIDKGKLKTDGLVKDCGTSSTLTMEISQFSA